MVWCCMTKLNDKTLSTFCFPIMFTNKNYSHKEVLSVIKNLRFSIQIYLKSSFGKMLVLGIKVLCTTCLCKTLVMHIDIWYILISSKLRLKRCLVILMTSLFQTSLYMDTYLNFNRNKFISLCSPLSYRATHPRLVTKRYWNSYI